MPDSVKNELPSMASVIQQAILNKLKELHTSMPGIIVSFDPVEQTAEVQPAIRRVFKISNTENKEILTPTDLPKLINVPVVFPRGGGFSLTFPVVEGDECLIQFCEREIDNWYVNGGIQNATTFRQHSLSDAICFVGIASQPNKIASFDADNVELRDAAGTTSVRITPDKKILLDAVTEIKITAPDTTWVGDINLTGDIVHTGSTNQTGDVTLAGDVDQTGDMDRTGVTNLTGAASASGLITSATDVVAIAVSLGAHLHSGVTPGGGTTGPPV